MTPTEVEPSTYAGETKTLQGRVKALEGQLSESKRLLELRNAELAQLQARVASPGNVGPDPPSLPASPVAPLSSVGLKPDLAIPVTDELQKEIDARVSALRAANIAFNTPASIRIHDPQELDLVLSLDASEQILRASIQDLGATESARTKSAAEMEALLIGSSGLTVTALQTSALQAVPSRGITSWKWRIEGTAAGAQSLSLSLFAVFGETKGTPRFAIKTFTRKLRVEVSATERLREFGANNWQWLWSALLVPLGALLWKQIRTHSGRGNLPTPNLHRPWKRASRNAP